MPFYSKNKTSNLWNERGGRVKPNHWIDPMGRRRGSWPPAARKAGSSSGRGGPTQPRRRGNGAGLDATAASLGAPEASPGAGTRAWEASASPLPSPRCGAVLRCPGSLLPLRRVGCGLNGLQNMGLFGPGLGFPALKNNNFLITWSLILTNTLIIKLSQNMVFDFTIKLWIKEHI